MDLAPPTRYREIAAPAPLAGAVVCTWINQVATGAAHEQRVLPDGCVDLIWFADAAPFVVGPMTRMSTATLAAGSCTVGIRLAPGRAAAVLGVPASALVDRAVPVSSLTRGAIAEPIDPALPAEARRRIAEQRLLAHGAARAADPLVGAAVAWLARHPVGRIAALARDTGLSERQLQRRIVEAVGYGPKTFQRIARFQRLLALARTPRDLSGLALDAGYADQAHMTREVRALSGRTPTALLGRVGSALAMSDLIQTPVALAG